MPAAVKLQDINHVCPQPCQASFHIGEDTLRIKRLRLGCENKSILAALNCFPDNGFAETVPVGRGGVNVVEPHVESVVEHVDEGLFVLIGAHTPTPVSDL